MSRKRRGGTTLDFWRSMDPRHKAWGTRVFEGLG